jgi:hypothetical protein
MPDTYYICTLIFLRFSVWIRFYSRFPLALCVKKWTISPFRNSPWRLVFVVQRNHFVSLQLLGTFILVLLWVADLNTHTYTHTHTLKKSWLGIQIDEDCRDTNNTWPGFCQVFIWQWHICSDLRWRRSYIVLYGVHVELINKLGGQGAQEYYADEHSCSDETVPTYTSAYFNMDTADRCSKHHGSSLHWRKPHRIPDVSPIINKDWTPPVFLCCILQQLLLIWCKRQSVPLTVLGHLRQWTFSSVWHDWIWSVSFSGDYYSNFK